MSEPTEHFDKAKPDMMQGTMGSAL